MPSPGSFRKSRKNERNREEFLRWDPDIAAGFGEQPGAASPEEQAKAIYTGFLEGNGVQLDEEQAAMWWIPNFQGSELRYEYTLLDLSGDGVPELLVQLAEDPG